MNSSSSSAHSSDEESFWMMMMISSSSRRTKNERGTKNIWKNERFQKIHFVKNYFQARDTQKIVIVLLDSHLTFFILQPFHPTKLSFSS